MESEMFDIPFGHLGQSTFVALIVNPVIVDFLADWRSPIVHGTGKQPSGLCKNKYIPSE